MKEQDLQDLKELIELLQEHQVSEFDLDRDGMKIRLKFDGCGATTATPSRTSGGAQSPSAAVPAAAVSGGTAESLHLVKSPIVGTFFSSPAPGASAFVAAGERVEKGQILCIVEAMKLMNEIECDAAGEVAKVLVTDGQAVEYGQPLFALRIA